MRDIMFSKMALKVNDLNSVRRGHEVMETELMDSDCISYDMVMYEEDGDSNLYSECKAVLKLFVEMRRFLRGRRVSGKSFSTGKSFFYWDWYRNVGAEQVNQHERLKRIMDGHSMKELCVPPFYDSIKMEVVESGLMSPSTFEEHIVQRAKQYLQQKQCRKMKSTASDGDDHFGIEVGSPLQPRHLHALFIYTNFTDLCKAFGETFRSLDEDESIEDINYRNSKYQRTAKALRELILYFGNHGEKWYGDATRTEEHGPFYTGMGCVLNIPAFTISFQGPTSTSKTLEIAVRFAGESGMVLSLNNKSGESQWERFINAKWFSCYPEEDERLFMGSTHYLTVEKLSIIPFAKSYKQSTKAFAKFDALLKGDESLFENNVTLSQWTLIQKAITNCLDQKRAAEVENSSLDAFSLDNFYLMTLQKTHIKLNLESIHNLSCTPLKQWFVHNTRILKVDEVPKDMTNVIKGNVLSLFPNLVTLTIHTVHDHQTEFRFSLQRLMDELSSVELPLSFSSISVSGSRSNGWLQRSVDNKLKRKALAMHFDVELTTTQRGAFDLVVLKKRVRKQ